MSQRLRAGALEQPGAGPGAGPGAVLHSDTLDHYRTCHMLERLLHAPPKLAHQLLFQIPPERQAGLIQRWAGPWGLRAGAQLGGGSQRLGAGP